MPAEVLSEICGERGAPPPPPPPSSPLFFLTRKLISEPKIVNNTRIVVVGASDTSLALLEMLTAVPYIHFTSLYLLSPDAAARLRSPRGAQACSCCCSGLSCRPRGARGRRVHVAGGGRRRGAVRRALVLLHAG